MSFKTKNANKQMRQIIIQYATKLKTVEEKENEKAILERKKLEKRLLGKEEGEDKVFFDKKAFYSQPLSKELYRFPLRSSDAYGWRQPIDRFSRVNFRRAIPEEEKVMLANVRKMKFDNAENKKKQEGN